MKNSIQNIVKTVSILSFFLTVLFAQAQAPQRFSYQAVIRNSSDALVINTTIGVRVSVLQGSQTGNAIYVETHISTTNSNGLVSLQIGGGTVATAGFSAINWSTGPYFIKTETDITGGNNYTIIGTSQLLSVPYALSSADNRWATIGGNIFSTNSGNVGIGTNAPNYKLHVGTSVHAMRIEGPGSNGGKALSMGGFGAIEIDAPGIFGGRFSIQDNGNIGIGTNVPTTKLEVNGFTKLGSDAPAIKIKKLTGLSSATAGGITSITHGIPVSKILAVNVLLEYQSGQFIPSNYTKSTGYEFNFGVVTTIVVIENTYTNSNSILGKPIRILITYEE